METLSVVSRKRSEFINITDLVKQSLENSGIQQGIGVIFLSSHNSRLNHQRKLGP